MARLLQLAGKNCTVPTSPFPGIEFPLCNGSTVLADGETCPLKCAEGFQYDERQYLSIPMRCINGALAFAQNRRCYPNACNAPSKIPGTDDPACQEGSHIPVGGECTLKCAAGYRSNRSTITLVNWTGIGTVEEVTMMRLYCDPLQAPELDDPLTYKPGCRPARSCEKYPSARKALVKPLVPIPDKPCVEDLPIPSGSRCTTVCSYGAAPSVSNLTCFDGHWFEQGQQGPVTSIYCDTSKAVEVALGVSDVQRPIGVPVAGIGLAVLVAVACVAGVLMRKVLTTSKNRGTALSTSFTSTDASELSEEDAEQ